MAGISESGRQLISLKRRTWHRTGIARLNARPVLEAILDRHWPESQLLQGDERDAALSRLELAHPPSSDPRKNLECPRCGGHEFSSFSARRQVWQCIQCRDRVYPVASLEHHGLPVTEDVANAITDFSRRAVRALPVVICHEPSCIFNNYDSARQEGRCLNAIVVIGRGSRECFSFMRNEAQQAPPAEQE